MNRKAASHVGLDLMRRFSRIELKQTEQVGGYFLENKNNFQKSICDLFSDNHEYKVIRSLHICGGKGRLNSLCRTRSYQDNLCKD